MEGDGCIFVSPAYLGKHRGHDGILPICLIAYLNPVVMNCQVTGNTQDIPRNLYKFHHCTEKCILADWINIGYQSNNTQ